MLQRKENKVKLKAEAYSDRIVKMAKCLKTDRHEYTISSQILRSGTSIGANIAESQYAQSRADFTSKLSISLKEANETKYWLEKLYSGGYINQQEFDSMAADNVELIKLLVAIIKTLKGK